jgi:hypothetical protein
MRNLTLTIQFSDICQSFVSATKYENTSITIPLLKLPITKIVIKVNKNDIDLCNYNLPERDEFVTKVIRVMIKFNKGVVIRPIVFKFFPTIKHESWIFLLTFIGEKLIYSILFNCIIVYYILRERNA